MWIRPILADLLARRPMLESDGYGCIMASANQVLQRTLGWKVWVTGTTVKDQATAHVVSVPTQTVSGEVLAVKPIRILGLEVKRNGIWYGLKPTVWSPVLLPTTQIGYPSAFSDRFGSFQLNSIPDAAYDYRALVAVQPSAEFFENIDLPVEAYDAILCGAMASAMEMGPEPNERSAESWRRRHLEAVGNLSGLLMASSGQPVIRASSFGRH